MSKRAKTNHASDGDYKLYDMTSYPGNAEILWQLKNDDPGLTVLNFGVQYLPEARSMGWLGYFVGESTNLKELYLNYLNHLGGVNRDGVLAFFWGLNRNRSVRKLKVLGPWGAEFQALTQFFAENKNLVEVVVSPNRRTSTYDIAASRVSHLSRALSSCDSLKSFKFKYRSSDGFVVAIINSLSEKSQLEEVGFSGSEYLGSLGYMALGHLLAWEGSQLQSLDVGNCEMGADDFECLLNAIASNRKLQKLNMAGYHSRDDDDQATLVLTRAWGSVERPLLKAFTSNLVELNITRSGGSMNDAGAIAFSHVLAGNKKLKVLRANWRQLTSRGWNAVSRLLCDTSSPETTYASNHTLQDLGPCVRASDANVDWMVNDLFPFQALNVDTMLLDKIVTLLALNKSDDKARVASTKILMSYDDFDMQVFFELEFKMLPIAIQWLARAAVPVVSNPPMGPNIQCRKLSMIYQFVRGAPKSFVECRVRRELEEIQARVERIRGEQERKQELAWLEERKRAIFDKLRGE